MEQYKKNLYRLPLDLTVDEINLGRDLDDLILIETSCFPDKMQDSSKEFKEFFDDDNAFGLIMYKDGKPIGYLSGTHAYGIDSEKSDDPDDLDVDVPLLRDNAEYVSYIASVAILPDYRSPLTLDYFFNELILLLKKYDYKYLLAYGRAKYGFSRILRQRYGAHIIKRDENWYGYNEPFDYLYIDLASIPIQNKILRMIFNGLRRFRKFLIKVK